MKTDALFSEQAGNVIENLACRLAEKEGGRITANHLAPYLPVSLGLVETVLMNMVDGSSVLTEDVGKVTWYEFPVYSGAGPQPGLLAPGSCISCDADISGPPGKVMCRECGELLRAELSELAERMGWPAQAVYEHEILYLAAGHGESVRAEALAGHSRYTLGRMRAKLEKLTLDGRVTEELDGDRGAVVYHFPRITYPRNVYRGHMQTIREYPASLEEELQIRFLRIIIALALLLLGLFVLAFFGIPFPVLVGVFFCLGSIVSVGIWRHRLAPDEE